MTSFSPLPGSAWVIRVVKRKPPLFDPGSNRLGPDAFRPTDRDREEAGERQRPVGASVFDLGRTRPEEALAIRAAALEGARRPVEPMSCWFLSIAEAREAGRTHGYPVDVVADPRVIPALPGIDGHCQLEGLVSDGPDRRVRDRALWSARSLAARVDQP